MSSVLRTIRYSKWWKNPDVSWLPPGELQADALRDIRTIRSALSVYLLGSEISRARIIGALAAKKDRLSQVDYVLLELNFLESTGLILRNTPEHGKTFDNDVNKVHYDIVNLSPLKLYELAQYISKRVTDKRCLCNKAEVAEFINHSIDSGYIDKNMLKDRLVRKLQNFR